MPVPGWSKRAPKVLSIPPDSRDGTVNQPVNEATLGRPSDCFAPGPVKHRENLFRPQCLREKDGKSLEAVATADVDGDGRNDQIVELGDPAEWALLRNTKQGWTAMMIDYVSRDPYDLRDVRVVRSGGAVYILIIGYDYLGTKRSHRRNTEDEDVRPADHSIYLIYRVCEDGMLYQVFARALPLRDGRDNLLRAEGERLLLHTSGGHRGFLRYDPERRRLLVAD